jgi:hypothetical protein
MTTVLVELQQLRERNEALEAQLDHVVRTYTEKVFNLKTKVAQLESALETAWARIDTQGEIIDTLEGALLEYDDHG